MSQKYVGKVINLRDSNKTAVVEIEPEKIIHKKYKSLISLKKKKIQAQNNEKDLSLGMHVEIISSRPFSAKKRFCVKKIIKN